MAEWRGGGGSKTEPKNLLGELQGSYGQGKPEKVREFQNFSKVREFQNYSKAGENIQKSKFLKIFKIIQKNRKIVYELGIYQHCLIFHLNNPGVARFLFLPIF